MEMQERKERAKNLVQTLESALATQNSELESALLHFYDVYNDDVGMGIAVVEQVWGDFWQTEMWRILEEYDIPKLVRSKRRHVYAQLIRDLKLQLIRA